MTDFASGCSNDGLERIEMRVVPWGRNIFGFIVTDGVGRIVHRDDISNCDCDAVPAIAVTIVVEPGEELELDKEWDQRAMKGKNVGRGHYRVVDVVNAHRINDVDIPEGSVATEPVTLRIR